MQAKPQTIEINAGIRKSIALNSKYIKSTTIGIKHITPIPIIKMPKFLIMISKSLLSMYLIYSPT